MEVNALGLYFLILVSIVSRVLYSHKGGVYAQNKRKKNSSILAFKTFEHYLRITTLLIGGGSFISSHWVLLKFHESISLFYLGLAIGTLGFVIFILAKSELGSNYSPCFDMYMPNTVCRTGIYSKIRHPIYTGNMLLLFGLTLMSGSIWLLLNFLLICYLYNSSAKLEEAELCKTFPEYILYMKNSGRFLKVGGANIL